MAGWCVTEVGRQPWTIYGLMRTENSVSPSLTGGDVLGSLIAYMIVYLRHVPVRRRSAWRGLVRASRGPEATETRRGFQVRSPPPSRLPAE